jgi:hypothetical protein
MSAAYVAARSVTALLDLGADPLIRENLHGGHALGWARVDGHADLADVLS